MNRCLNSVSRRVARSDRPRTHRHAWLGRAVLLGGLPLAVPGDVLAQPRERTAAQAARAPEPQADDSIAALDRRFNERQRQIERERIAALADLAGRQEGAPAEATYRYLFALALMGGLLQPAEPVATRYLEREGGEARTRTMAALVQVLAASEAGQIDAAIEHLTRFLKAPRTVQIEPTLLYSLGESFLQRLIAQGKHEAAERVCSLFTETAGDAGIRDHFASRLERLRMVGQPAPGLAGEDLDGEPLRPEDLKGKVVLVAFWATWAPPSLAEIPRLNSLQLAYGNRGLEVVGVNVDAAREGVNPQEALAQARQLVVDQLVPWRVLVQGAPGSETDLVKAFGVKEVPASFLIDRQGIIARVELSGPALERAVAEMLGDRAGAAEATGGAAPVTPSEPTQPIDPATQPAPDTPAPR